MIYMTEENISGPETERSLYFVLDYSVFFPNFSFYLHDIMWDAILRQTLAQG